MTENFERAFIQCLREGIYPGPSNINERFRQDKLRINRLNGQYSKMRIALMHAFGVPYQRGVIDYAATALVDPGGSGLYRVYKKGQIPEYPYLTMENAFGTRLSTPKVGYRKHEIQDPNEPWKLRRK